MKDGFSEEDEPINVDELVSEKELTNSTELSSFDELSSMASSGLVWQDTKTPTLPQNKYNKRFIMVGLKHVSIEIRTSVSEQNTGPQLKLCLR